MTVVGAVLLLGVGLVVLINGGSTLFGVAMICVALIAAFRGWQRWQPAYRRSRTE